VILLILGLFVECYVFGFSVAMMIVGDVLVAGCNQFFKVLQRLQAEASEFKFILKVFRNLYVVRKLANCFAESCEKSSWCSVV